MIVNKQIEDGTWTTQRGCTDKNSHRDVQMGTHGNPTLGMQRSRYGYWFKVSLGNKHGYIRNTITCDNELDITDIR